MSDLKIGKIEFGPLQCSQGGIPYNKEHLDAKNARIAELEAENAKLIDEDNLWKHAQEMGYQKAIDDIKADNERLRAVYDAATNLLDDFDNDRVDVGAIGALRQALKESDDE